MKKLLRTETYKCIIQHFADGDTCKVLVECGHCFIWQLQYLRIRGIDAHEVRSASKSLALAAAAVLTEKYKGVQGELILTQTSSDKYGRMVGDIKIVDDMLSKLVVDSGHAWYV